MSSDSSDNEDLELLREAQDTQFLKENLYSQDKDRTSEEVQEKPISLRITKDENEQFNFLKVTPEFRNFVAKHLTKLLDNKLERELEYDAYNREIKRKRKNSGVRLFSHSKKLLKVGENLTRNINLCTNKTRINTVLKQDIVATDEDLRILAVSGEYILSKKDTEHWSNRSKSETFTYKKNKNGKLEIIEPKFKES